MLLIAPMPGFLGAQEDDSDGYSAGQLLEEALLFSADVSVTDTADETELWNTLVEKITIPGRPVNVSLESGDARLTVEFTLYPTKDDELLLVAQSETWFGDEYSSALTSLAMAYRDEVYYYPLGRAADGSVENPVEVRMTIKTLPYLETLDDASRAALEAAIDSSARFDLSGEDR